MLEQAENSRTKINLENMFRMTFHPRGCREFMEDMNKELELGPKQSSMNIKLGAKYDILKYILYAGVIGELTYELFR